MSTLRVATAYAVIGLLWAMLAGAVVFIIAAPLVLWLTGGLWQPALGVYGGLALGGGYIWAVETLKKKT